ncbi:MAG TPA: alpha/beta fold hydrolase [Spirochaetes bacterium]|nr:alpha/beta fold hydrolase [Spirochaetota bacterium]
MNPDISAYSAFDRTEILMYLFYPRKQQGPAGHGQGYVELAVPVAPGISIGGRLYLAGNDAPNLLFFHGNGEIVDDYDDIGIMYSRNGINFWPFDYRGYGISGGAPTVSAMMSDCHSIFERVIEIIRKEKMTGPLAVMGRSLGSASAIELASSYQDRVSGLVVESGFARAVPLLRLLGIDVDGMGLAGNTGFDNIDKITKYNKPTLIIHGEYDQIIPYGEAELLYGSSASPVKKLIKIEGADHNTIFMVGLDLYMRSIGSFFKELR